jgi:regulation of enolase protein 1 (concanavalin A-like superfamily)
MAYDNSKTPFYSETQHQWASPQNWTGHGINTLQVYVRGDAPAFLEVSPGTIIMNGTGSDIWNASDQFRFACKSLSGDGTIIARVDGLANTHEWAKAGVMIRETLDATSNFAFVAATPNPTHGISFQRRTPDATAGANTDVASQTIPVWVKLTRKGDTFTAQLSSDGVAWTDIAVNPAVSIQMGSSVLIGLAVCSHDAAQVTAAKFSHVSTSGGVSGTTWQMAEIGVAQAAGNAYEPFYVGLQDKAGKLAVVSSADTTLIAASAWQQFSIPLSQFSSAGVNLASIQKIIIGVGDRNTPKAGSSGKVYIDDIQLARVAP